MITGILISLIFLLVCGKYIAHKSGHFIKIFNKIHKPLALGMLAVTIIHMVNTWKLLSLRPLVMYFAGVIMVILMIVITLSYYFKNIIGIRWIKIHRICTLILVPVLCIHIFIGIYSLYSYKSIINKIHLSPIDVTTVEDGDYIGEFDAGYIYAKVDVIVEKGKLKSIKLLDHDNEKGKPAKAVIDEMVTKQSTVVDAVSGATNSSYVIMKAVENALSK